MINIYKIKILQSYKKYLAFLIIALALISYVKIGILLAINPFIDNIYIHSSIVIFYFAIVPFSASIISNLVEDKFNISIVDKRELKSAEVLSKLSFITMPIKNLLRGEIRLWITFWIFGILGMKFLNSLCDNFNQIDKFDAYFLHIVVLDIFSPIYMIFIWISIWNSADKYKGSQILAASAKLAVIASISIVFRQLGIY